MKDVTLFKENVTLAEIQESKSELPSDIHLVEYVRGQDLFLDAVRAYKMVDIFDVYHDKLDGEVREGLTSNFEIVSITSGYGSIKPRLWTGA